MAWLDAQLVFDASTRRCDIDLGADGDLALDETPATPMLISYGSDRRARADDELPSGASELNQPVSFVERRGWAGDALDIAYRQIGSRLWLLERAKESELTRLLVAEWSKEAFAWAADETTAAAEIEVAWLRKGVLGQRIRVDGHDMPVTRKVGGG